MQKDELKQNVKSYAQKFEDGGLRLLKKGQKGVIHAIFSRFGLVLLLLLLQVGLLVSIFRWFGNLLPHYFGGSVVVTAAMVLYLLNSKMDNSAKITWMVVIALFPVVGVPLFFYVKSNFGHNILRKRLLELEDVLRTQLPQNQSVVQKLEASEPGAASLATYLYGRGGPLADRAVFADVVHPEGAGVRRLSGRAHPGAGKCQRHGGSLWGLPAGW